MIKSALYVDFCECFACEVEKKGRKNIIILKYTKSKLKIKHMITLSEKLEGKSIVKKRLRKICVMEMIVCLIISNISMPVMSQENTTEEQEQTFSGEGEGTKLNPYQITNADQLKEITKDMSAYYVLANDIDLSNISSWEPIGTEENEFTGELDGQGYTIDHMTIEDDGLQYVGLFGYCDDYATIKNIQLKNVQIEIDKKYHNRQRRVPELWEAEKDSHSCEGGEDWKESVL